MSVQEAVALVRILRSPALPLSLWWLSFSAVSVFSIELLLHDLSPALQLPVKVAAYVTSATTALLGLGMVVTFGLCCAGALRWLSGTVSMRAVTRAVCLGTWAFAANTGVTAIALLKTTPEPFTADQLATSSSLRADAEALLGISWLTEAQYVAGILFLAIVFLTLSRQTSRINALLAVAFATSLVLFITAVLRTLAASFSPI